jgi:SAM-dependent methyltransferase
MSDSPVKRRARQALERQLDYQRAKSESIRGHERETMAAMKRHSVAVHDRLTRVQPLPAAARVLEVGSGAHGLIFFFDAPVRLGVDPLADHYRTLFPAWQGRAETLAAGGEHLPLDDCCFDVVLCDNVVDHAENPRQILREIARVLTPGGLLYFTVNVHHPVYHWAATLHAGWRALGIPFEITPFADHTVHLTPGAAHRLFTHLPLRIVDQSDRIAEAVRESRAAPPRHAGDRLKRWFFKNALWEVVAIKEETLASAPAAP